MTKERELTYRFVELPHVLQLEVMKLMWPVGRAEDAVGFFEYCKENGLLSRLWDEVAKRHDPPLINNPFRNDAGMICHPASLKYAQLRAAYQKVLELEDDALRKGVVEHCLKELNRRTNNGSRSEAGNAD